MATTDLINVLPDEVSKDRDSEGAIILVRLNDVLPKEEMATVMQRIASRLIDLQRPRRGERNASITLGLGRRFFARYPEHAANAPSGFAQSLDLHAPEVETDIAIYATLTAERVVPELLQWLEDDPSVASIEVERGARTQGDREVFGQRDGLRGVPRNRRADTVFIAEERQPDEPKWLRGGTYGAYIKIQQNKDAWRTLDPATQEAVIGRREVDGSRIDLPAGTDPHTEGDFTTPDTPSRASHVRKSGPRGNRDRNLILRRGLPYTEEADGNILTGLQFVSYQASPRQLDVILNDWMFNPDFTDPGIGQDALIAHNLLQFLRSALFVVPPHDDRFPGAGYFDSLPSPIVRKGRLLIEKSIQDANGTLVRSERGDIVIELVDKTTNQIIETCVTNPAGRAVSKKMPIGSVITIRESNLDTTRFQPFPEFDVTVSEAVVPVPVVNRLLPGQPMYR